MIKKIFLFLIIAILAGGLLIFFFGSSALNKGIKTGVEKFGPEVTQTSVQLNEVNVSGLSGKGTLKGLYVGNPEGYKNEHILALEQIDIEIDTDSVFGDQIIINKIHILKPDISYEKKLLSSNMKQLIKNIEEFSGSADDSTKDNQPADASSKQVIIKELIIEDGTIYVGLMGAGATVPLPRIEMKNIGEKGEKKNMAEVIELILTEVLKSIGPAIAGAGDLVSDSGKAIGEQGGNALEKASEGIKNLFGK